MTEEDGAIKKGSKILSANKQDDLEYTKHELGGCEVVDGGGENYVHSSVEEGLSNIRGNLQYYTQNHDLTLLEYLSDKAIGDFISRFVLSR
jgi:hypothetical protein